MAMTKQPARKSSKGRLKPVGRHLSNADLLKLAAKQRPPQSWYDDQPDPTKPSPSNGRGK
jgi:hypothetical protein